MYTFMNIDSKVVTDGTINHLIERYSLPLLALASSFHLKDVKLIPIQMKVYILCCEHQNLSLFSSYA